MTREPADVETHSQGSPLTSTSMCAETRRGGPAGLHQHHLRRAVHAVTLAELAPEAFYAADEPSRDDRLR